jgi:hypothetical protein
VKCSVVSLFVTLDETCGIGFKVFTAVVFLVVVS